LASRPRGHRFTRDWSLVQAQPCPWKGPCKFRRLAPRVESPSPAPGDQARAFRRKPRTSRTKPSSLWSCWRPTGASKHRTPSWRDEQALPVEPPCRWQPFICCARYATTPSSIYEHDIPWIADSGTRACVATPAADQGVNTGAIRTALAEAWTPAPATSFTAALAWRPERRTSMSKHDDPQTLQTLDDALRAADAPGHTRRGLLERAAIGAAGVAGGRRAGHPPRVWPHSGGDSSVAAFGGSPPPQKRSPLCSWRACAPDQPAPRGAGRGQGHS